MAWGSFSTGGGGGGADTPTAAANVTYDNSKTKIDAANVQEALDYTLGLAQPRLTVTIDAGSQLTITCGDEEITGQTDGEGTFTTNLPMLGEWTIQAQKAARPPPRRWRWNRWASSTRLRWPISAPP